MGIGLSATKAKVGGFIISASPVLTLHARQLAALAMQHRLPAIYDNRVFAEAGGLMIHGPNESEFSWRRAHALLGG
jgi:putative ABC transport system substrate-binding protein